MSQKQIALQLRAMASDPDSQTLIVKEGQFLKGLLIFLDSPDEEVLIISVQALLFLSQHPNNKQPLREWSGLLKKVEKLLTHNNTHVKQFSSSIIENLTKKEPTSTVSSKTEGKSKKKFCSITIDVEMMSSMKQRNLAEAALIGVKGVISVTFPSDCPGKVMVYCSRSVEYMGPLLISSIENNTGLEAEITASVADANRANFASSSSSSSKSKSKAAYLSNDNISASASGPQKAGYLNKNEFSAAGEKGAVAVTGQNTLQARYTQQQKLRMEKQHKKGMVKSYIKSFTNFFW